MTTKNDLIEGFRMIIREGERVTSGFAREDWAKPAQGNEGWNRKQVYCHLTATAEIVPAFVGRLSQLESGQDAGAGFDINAFNAQQVARLEELDEAGLMQSYRTAHEKLIDFVQQLPDEQLGRPAKFGPVQGTMAEVMDSTLVLHGLAHIYTAGASAEG